MILLLGMWLYRSPMYQFYLHHLPWRRRCTCWDDGETCSDKMMRAAKAGQSFRSLRLIAGATSTVMLIAMLAGIMGCQGSGASVPNNGCGHGIPHDLHAFIVKTLVDLHDSYGKANVNSIACWAAQENTTAYWNPLATTMNMPGHQGCFNYINGYCGVRNYDSLAIGAKATARTIRLYSGLTSALSSGGGICGYQGDFLKWSDNAYSSVC